MTMCVEEVGLDIAPDEALDIDVQYLLEEKVVMNRTENSGFHSR